jgi:hypothetical protein
MLPHHPLNVAPSDPDVTEHPVVQQHGRRHKRSRGRANDVGVAYWPHHELMLCELGQIA